MKKHVRSFPWFPIAVMVLALLVVLWPLLRPGYYQSDDGEWMVIRLSAFYQSLANGQFPVRYLGRLNNSYGYPVANFLYPGFLYLGSLLRLAGLSFPDAVKTIVGVSVAGGAFAVLSALRTRFRMIPSLMGAASFIFAPYLLYDLYQRGSVGEVLAIAAATGAVLSLMKGWPWLLAPTIGLLIVSHNTVALIIGIAIMVLILIHPARRRMMVSAALGVGAATFFWLPALFEKRLVLFDTVTVSDPSAYFVAVENAGLLGFSTVIAFAVVSGLRTKRTLLSVILAVFVFVGMFLSLPLSYPLWRVSNLAPFVQFPYRFLVLAVVFGPWVVAEAATGLKGWKLRLFMVLCVGLWILGTTEQLYTIRFVNRPEGYYTTNEGTTNVADEYMPRWVTDIPKHRPVETLEIVDGDAEITERTFFGERMEVTVDAKETSLIQINKIYYPGWGVTIDHRLVPVDCGNPLGVMRVTVPKGTHTLSAAFRETPFRFAADAVSLLSIIVYLVLLRRFCTVL